MSRLITALAALVLVSVPVAAAAQEITFELQIDDGDGSFRPASPIEQQRYFNRVHCECDSAYQIRYRLAEGVDPSLYDDQLVSIWIGAQCTDPDFQVNCLLSDNGINDFGDLQTFIDREYTVRQLIALSDVEPCPTAIGANTMFALVNTQGDGAFESTSTLEIAYDTRPPILPTDAQLRGGEEAVTIALDLDDLDDDLQSYQILCAEVANPGEPVRSEPQTALYDRVGSGEFEQCGSDFAIEVAGGSTDVPLDLLELNPEFICGQASNSNTSIRVDGLENGKAYHVVLVGVDLQRNASAVYLGVAEPRPAVDFWELYQDEGGSAEGGCNGGGTTSLLLALMLGGLVLRLRRRGKALIAVLVIASLPSLASAQPYWDELDEKIEEEGHGPRWNVGIKLGPYTPSVNDEFSGVGPFERTFGSKDGLMSQVDVEWFFAYPLGQLGLALSLGYHAQSAKAFETRDDGTLRRTEDEKTTFRLIPTTLSVVYRFTYLDDQFRIPVIPYGRLGLAYYYWQITSPGGDVAETDSAGKGRGGSLGWQGALGLAIRAERIDKGAAASLRNEFGVEHAGIYAELNLANVDGFGSDSKLSVGDFTWFAGVNFEF